MNNLIYTSTAAGLWTPASALAPWATALNATNFRKKDFAGENGTTLKTLARHWMSTLPQEGDVHLVGHSVMGLLAQYIVRKMPNVRATLIAPAPPGHITTMIGGKTLWLQMLKSGIGQTRLLRRRIKPSPKDMKILMCNRVNTSSESTYLNPEGEPFWWVWDILLMRIHTPRLGKRLRIISGRNDQMITSGTCAKIAKRHGCEIRYTNAGHLPFIEPNSTETLALIQDMSWGFEN